MTPHWRAGARWRALERYLPVIGSSLFIDSEKSERAVQESPYVFQPGRAR
jgi:hypothetical protein